MDFNKIYNRAKNIIIKPVEEWEVVKGETEDKKEVILNYALPLLVLIAIASLVGSSFTKLSLGFSFLSVLVTAIIVFVVQFLVMFLSAFIINELAPSFGSKKDINAAFKLVIYASTASYVASILSGLIPVLSVLFGIFGLYSIYLFWTGLTPMMETPENKKVGYIIVSFLIIVAITLILGAIFRAIGLASML
ncbi:MAG: hypothetical protein DRJ01_06900 [Bacteroidetes bacterium]|nr:MAG: hypothetical protein DRJ01_06900 [Bacteroidota bacterium]